MTQVLDLLRERESTKEEILYHSQISASEWDAMALDPSRWNIVVAENKYKAYSHQEVFELVDSLLVYLNADA